MKSFNDIFNAFKDEVKGNLNTSLGVNQSVYKDEIFDGLTDSEKKRLRSKIRKSVISVFETLTTCTDETKIKTLVNSFVAFYNETYRVNDFSVSSICNDNSKHKDLFTKGLAIVAKYVQKKSK